MVTPAPEPGGDSGDGESSGDQPTTAESRIKNCKSVKHSQHSMHQEPLIPYSISPRHTKPRKMRIGLRMEEKDGAFPDESINQSTSRGAVDGDERNRMAAARITWTEWRGGAPWTDCWAGARGGEAAWGFGEGEVGSRSGRG